MMTKRREFRETLKLIEILKNKYNKYQEKSSVNFFEIKQCQDKLEISNIQ